MTAAIVLAAGASTRMGANKMLLELNGEPIVRRVARVTLAASLDPVVVVLGRDAELVRQHLSDLAVQTVVNPAFSGPTVSSLRRGLDALGADTRAAIVVLADMVGVHGGMLRALIEADRRGDAPAVASRYGPIIAPPHLFRRELFDELRAEAGAGAGRAVIARHTDRVRFVDWPAAALSDVDARADYERARRASGPRRG